jgi:hypothetical protein
MTRPPVEHRSVASDLTEARADTAAALWFAEQVLTIETPMDTIMHEGADSSWADQTAISLTGFTKLGVTSMGPSTRRIVETLATIAADSITVVSNSAVVIRGLEDLGVDMASGDPAAAEVCLIPVAATIEHAVWTSPAAAAAFGRSARPVVLADPVTALGSWASTRFRPAEWMMRLDQPPASGAPRLH